MMDLGALKSISAIHIGRASLIPNTSSVKSHFIEFVLLRLMTVSKSYFILLWPPFIDFNNLENDNTDNFIMC